MRYATIMVVAYSTSTLVEYGNQQGVKMKRMISFYVEGWESSPREIYSFIFALVMLLGTIIMMPIVMIAIMIPGFFEHPEWGVPIIFSTFLIVIPFAYREMRKMKGDLWLMSSKMWEEPKVGAVDTIGDVLKGEGISYTRTGPLRIKGSPPFTFDQVFEMDGLRLMVLEGPITCAYVGPLPYFGSERANEVMRLVNRALE